MVALYRGSRGGRRRRSCFSSGIGVDVGSTAGITDKDPREVSKFKGECSRPPEPLEQPCGERGGPPEQRSERHCCPAGLDRQLQTASQPSGDALSRAPICGQTQRKRFRAGAKRPLVSLPGERPSWQPQDLDLHGIPECCHVRSSGTKGLREAADAGGAAIGVHRAGGPRRRVVTFGPSSDVLGGSTICPDGVASHGSCRTALRAVRFLLGSNPTGLPSVRRARVMCPREQSLKPFHKWDSVGCLALLNAKQSDPQCRCGLFAVTKMQRRIL